MEKQGRTEGNGFRLQQSRFRSTLRTQLQLLDVAHSWSSEIQELSFPPYIALFSLTLYLLTFSLLLKERLAYNRAWFLEHNREPSTRNVTSLLYRQKFDKAKHWYKCEVLE